MTEPRAFRGYVGSRPIRRLPYPQRVQNLVIRDYAQRRGLRYLLSIVEHAMPGDYMLLYEILDDLPNLGGMIFFSAFMLPPEPARRHAIYERFFATGTELHAALEQLVVASPRDVAAIEAILDVASVLERTPFGGRYEKTDTPLRVATQTERTLLAAASTVEP